MFHGRQLNEKIKKIQERALRITYKDTESIFIELLQKNCAFTVQLRVFQLLVKSKMHLLIDVSSFHHPSTTNNWV